MHTRTLALFDFDGTITTKDTLFVFCRFVVGDARFVAGLLFLSPVLVSQKLKLISGQRAKEIFLNYFIGGMEEDYFNKKCEEFTSRKLTALIRPAALHAIQEYRQSNATVFIVSASPQNWIMPWATLLNINVIATQLQVNKGLISGKIEGKNCNGEEKVIRIRKQINLNEYDEIAVYGDSKGDEPMLQLAHHKFFKPFRGKN